MNTIVLDIGGTAIKSGLYQNDTLSHIRETPTQADLGGAHVVALALKLIAEYRSICPPDRIGISTAGQVNPVEGSIIYANENIPGYTGTKLKDIVEQEFHVPTAVANDVNAAAIGEAVFGAGKDQTDFVCLTYGTGVGGALFCNGGLYTGSSYSAGEFGGIVTHPADRDPEKDLFSGCYERYASTTALIRKAMRLSPAFSDGRILFAHQSEPAVAELIDNWILEIVYGLITIIHMLNPSCAILGGGILAQPCVLPKIREKLFPNLMPAFRHVRIEKAKLGNRAGMLGAAVLDRVL